MYWGQTDDDCAGHTPQHRGLSLELLVSRFKPPHISDHNMEMAFDL